MISQILKSLATIIPNIQLLITVVPSDQSLITIVPNDHLLIASFQQLITDHHCSVTIH